MFKVTLKIKPNGEWVDGPIVLVRPKDMEAFTQTHHYFKCEDATLDDGYVYVQWRTPKAKVPKAFAGFLFNEDHNLVDDAEI